MTQQIVTVGGNPLPVLLPGTTQNVAVGASSVQSNAFAATTEIVRCVSTIDCWLAFGTNPTAVADASNNSFFLPAGVVEFFAVPLGQSYEVAVIQDAAVGTLSVMEAA